MDYLLELVARFLAAVIVLTLHEFAHAFVAWKCGDPTAKFSGRMSLNPMRHFDPLGMLLFALAGFGWAKPVPVNPGNFKKYRSGCFWTSAAGVIVNYLSAFLFYPLYMLVFTYFLGDTYGHLLVGSFVHYEGEGLSLPAQLRVLYPARAHRAGHSGGLCVVFGIYQYSRLSDDLCDEYIGLAHSGALVARLLNFGKKRGVTWKSLRLIR